MIAEAAQLAGIPVGDVAAARAAFLEAVAADAAGIPFVIQVGAHDGRMADPIFSIAKRQGWHGLLIEPHPAYFARLTERYRRREGIDLLNVAISDREGALPLYHLDDGRMADFPRWVHGSASFDRQRVVRQVRLACRKAGMPYDDALVAETVVPVRRLDEVLAERGIARADLMVVDVEGHELAVLASLDLRSLGLVGMLVECNGRNLPEEPAYASALARAGFAVFRLGDDLCAFAEPRLPGLGAALAAAGFAPIGLME